MSKALIIAEKPSVAADIARALGGFAKDKSGDFYESDRFVLSSAVGHLLELVPPEGVEAARGKWTFQHLPVIPPHFDLKPIERNENRLKVLARLIRRKDVEALINACDAGREGELIFRNIVKHTHARQPVKRLWLQSMTPAAIREGFERLRGDEEMMPLANAAFSRSEADWLVGINGTRAMTAFNSKSGGFFKTTVGRVQTPTLAVVVEREEKIRKFVPRDFWEVIGTFDCAAGRYTGRWFDEKFQKPGGQDGDDQLRPERLWEKSRAEAIRDKCLGKPGVVTEESKPTTSLSPLLYDLTSLQRDANSRFGFSAKNTLGLAQALYERHKVLTYPRTDARALPEDYAGTVKDVLGALAGGRYALFAETILKNDWVRPNKRIFNNAKISDHFAIIPTPQTPKGLTEPEQKLYDLVTKRFLAVFYPAAEFLETTRITRVEGEPFKSAGKVLVNPGWLALYGKESDADETASLPPVKPEETVGTREVEVKQNITKPPPRYTEATLLSAMEGAGRLVEDDELREAMREKGLGTPATRAAIIEGLIYEQYLLRNGRELQPTAKAFSLMELLNGLGIPELTRPELTGDWEFKLRQIQRRQKSRDEFMTEIADMTRHIVERAKKYEHDTIPGDFGVLKTPCPKCGGEVRERYKQFQCVRCDFSLSKTLCGRMFEMAEAEKLIAEKQIGPLQGFRSRMGKPFAAVLKLNGEFRMEFDFGDNGRNAEGAAPVDFTGKTPLGQCPKCGARVFDAGMSYLCEKAAGPEKTCDFRVGKIILQENIEPAQMTRLLAGGKTDLLKNFVSKKNNRKFEAFLVLKDGKIGFEFPPRKAGAKAAARKTAAPGETPPKVDFAGREPLGQCPKCGGRVFQTDAGYLCERSQADKKPCRFKISGEILSQPIEPAQVRKVLADGRTDLLDKFISKSGKPFPAYLVMDEKGKVTFEFPPREQGTAEAR
ncbi:MAG: DNA topoisomerase III [Verrucomicrobiota bacterium]|nr:DNA topoisomerase III [Verrucomicrobiota bacterium]